MPVQRHSFPTTRLTLVPPRPRNHSPLALWHLLSFDAPTIAALWTVFVAHASHITLPWTSPAAMFLAVWMLYAADRLLDARHTAPQHLEERHRFHHRHRRAFLTAILIASIALACLLPTIDTAALRIYAILTALLCAYFFLIHIHSPADAHRLPKELAVGIFFPAAIFIPTIARAPQLRLTLLPSAILFAAVCTLNCLYLYAWEHTALRSSAHWTTRLAIRYLALLNIITIALACIVFLLSRFATPAIATALAACLLLILHSRRHHLSRVHLRAAADLTLLTPTLLLPFTR